MVLHGKTEILVRMMFGTDFQTSGRKAHSHKKNWRKCLLERLCDLQKGTGKTWPAQKTDDQRRNISLALKKPVTHDLGEANDQNGAMKKIDIPNRWLIFRNEQRI